MARQPRFPPNNSSGNYSNIDSLPSSPSQSTHSHSQQHGGISSPLNPDGQRYYDENGTNGVANGQVGGSFGPYSYSQVGGSDRGSFNPPPSFSSRPESSASGMSRSASNAPAGQISAGASGAATGGGIRAPVWTARDSEMDDRLHNPSPLKEDRSCATFSARGWLNMGALVLLVSGLVTLFAGYPIIQYYGQGTLSKYGAYGVGGINATGQVPFINNLPALIDAATPQGALSRTGFDGHKYVLMFSDEFNTDGRTFWPGDDPYWEAVDLHYWATGDFEWYDPDAVTTKGGNLVFTISEEPIHNLNFRSGMLQSWNKLCFTGGYIEVSIQLPGLDTVSGFWPGAWTIGNLARAGYGATTDGTWPFSYSSCDIGTLKNQTNVAGTGPAAALNSGSMDYGGSLSYQPGQRLSSCTCSGGDHPGPNVGVGRGAPEIDILEAQVSYVDGGFVGSVSQSAQFAPYDTGYEWLNTTPAAVLYNPANSYYNTYTGGIYQEAVSAVTYTNPTAYQLGGAAFSKYGFETWPDTAHAGVGGFITWSVGETAAWTMNAAAVGPSASAGVGQRLVSQEPMSIVLNLGMSSSFQTINWAELKLPAQMLVDYVRVYQRADSPNIGCDPPAMPTADYINSHLKAYMDPNTTTWQAAGYSFPKNKLTGC